jgi:hypothetical protein
MFRSSHGKWLLAPLALLATACTPHRTETPMVVVSQPAVIVSPVPAPRQVNVVPVGYRSCMLSRPGYYNRVWVSSHRVCRYQQPGRVTWVDGYWFCSQYDVAGRCLFWDWRASRWERVVVQY